MSLCKKVASKKRRRAPDELAAVPPLRPDAPKALEPGLYRAQLAECTAQVTYGGHWFVEWHFDVRGPLGASGRLSAAHELDDQSDIDHLRRMFAVAGVALDGERDLALACREVVGKQFYIELLPGTAEEGDMLHVQQLATTYNVAVPDEYDGDLSERYGFTSQMDFECLEGSNRGRDLSDPGFPMYHGCTVAEKAELRLSPPESIRVARAAAEQGKGY